MFQWNSNFSGTVILQLWLLSFIPFRHFVFTVNLSEAYPLKIYYLNTVTPGRFKNLNPLVIPRTRLIGVTFRGLVTNFSAC